MQYITELNAYQSEKSSAVTLGKFDALHKGHQKLIRKICEYAGADADMKSIVCAFDMGRKSLLTKNEKRRKLEEQVDVLIDCSFTKELREMEAEAFIKEIIHEKFHASYVVVGADFQFGYGKRGDVSMLEAFSAQYGYKLDVVEKEKYEEKVISSTYVREVLALGDVKLANRLLGYPYQISGSVEHGRQLGRKLGFPTMNVIPEERKIVPRYGVYGCRVCVDGIWYDAIGNVGVKPTISDGEKPTLEVFAFGYDGDAYGKQIITEFYKFMRPEMKFSSVEELKNQVDTDMKNFLVEMKGIYK